MESKKDPSHVIVSCCKNEKDGATFFENVKGHIDELIHSSMDEHVTCFKNTMSKMFRMSKTVAQRNSEAQEEVERALPLQTTVPK